MSSEEKKLEKFTKDFAEVLKLCIKNGVGNTEYPASGRSKQWKQGTLAEAAGITRQRMNMFCNARKLPDDTSFENIFRALKSSKDEHQALLEKLQKTYDDAQSVNKSLSKKNELPSESYSLKWCIPNLYYKWPSRLYIYAGFFLILLLLIPTIWLWEPTNSDLGNMKPYDMSLTPEQRFKAIEEILSKQSQIDKEERKQAINLLKQDPEKALKLFSRMIATIPTSEVANIQHHIGVITFHTHPNTSYKAFKRAVELNPKDGDAWTQLGHHSRNFGEIEEANKAYQNALRIARKPTDKDPELEAMSLGSIGTVLLIQGKYFEGEKLIREALAIDTDLGRKCGMADSYDNLGVIYRLRYNPDKALEYYNKAYQSYKCKNDRRAYDLEKKISEASQLKHRFPEFSESCNKILEGMNHIDQGTPNGIQYCKAAGLLRAGELSRAKSMFEDLLAQHAEAKNRKAAIWDYVGLGDASVGLKEYENGLAFYQKALLLAKETGSELQLSHVYLKIAHEHFNSCRYQNALVDYENAENTFRDAGDGNMAKYSHNRRVYVAGILSMIGITKKNGRGSKIEFSGLDARKCPFEKAAKEN